MGKFENYCFNMSLAKENFEVQKKLTGVILLMYALKIAAWVATDSVAILSDAMEYTINVIAGFVGLYSLYISAKPKDFDHPYGHGRVEFISAAVEGTLMIVSGGIIIYEAIKNLIDPQPISKLDYGLILVMITAIVNYVVGTYSVRTGTKNNSLPLIAAGKHMQTDTYTTVGVVIGLGLIIVFKLYWLDSVVALLVTIFLFYSGYKIIRTSIAGIMDEADTELLNEIISVLNENRRENWIDLHNLRIIKYGSILHLDCHLTIPWYFNIHQGHDEVKALEDLVRERFGESVELFVHTDGCLEFSCRLCTKTDCVHRVQPFVRRVEWTIENVSSNSKHMV